MIPRNETKTTRSIDYGNRVITNGMKITSSVVWDNPNQTNTWGVWNQECLDKNYAISLAESLNMNYVLKLVFESKDNMNTRYVASDYETYDEFSEYAD